MKRDEDWLSEAVDLSENGDFGAALGMLLQHYRSRPSHAVAEKIAWLGELAASQLHDRDSLDDENFGLVVAAGQPEDCNRAMAFVVSGTVTQASSRCRKAIQWPEDPRVDRTLLAWLQNLPYRTVSSQKFWSCVVERLGTSTDSYVVDALQDLTDSYKDRLEVAMRIWLTRKVSALHEQLTLKFENNVPYELSSSERHRLDLLPKHQPERLLTTQERLLQRVLDDPSDDSARFVYADYLMESGQPHGTLIQLQLQKQSRKLTSNERKLEEDLIKQHWRDFVGPIGAVLRADSLEFRRGFLSRCEVNIYLKAQIESLVGNPMWATLEEISGPGEIVSSPVMRSMRSLIIYTNARARLTELINGRSALPIEKLKISWFEWSSIEILDEPEIFPELQSLWIHFGWFRLQNGLKSLITGELFQRIRHLRIDLTDDYSVDEFVAYFNWMITGPNKLETLAFHMPNRAEVIVESNRDGVASKLSVAFGPEQNLEVASFLKRLNFAEFEYLEFNLIDLADETSKEVLAISSRPIRANSAYAFNAIRNVLKPLKLEAELILNDRRSLQAPKKPRYEKPRPDRH